MAALADDLNTPLAVAELHDIASTMNKAKDEGKREALAGGLLAGGALLGLLQDDPEAWFKGAAAEGALAAEDVEAMIAARIAARRAKNFTEADRIRDDLLAQGITLEDGPGGTIWRRVD
jgi:cysteinyl-tRNA synthetase